MIGHAFRLKARIVIAGLMVGLLTNSLAMAQGELVLGPDKLWVVTKNTQFWEHNWETRQRIQLAEGESHPEIPAGTVVFEDGRNVDYIVAIVPGERPRIGWIVLTDVVRIKNFDDVYYSLISPTGGPAGRDEEHDLTERTPPRVGDHLPTRESPHYHAARDTFPRATVRRPSPEQPSTGRPTQPAEPQYKAGVVYELTQDIHITKDSGIQIPVFRGHIVKCIEMKGDEALCVPFVGGEFCEDLTCWIPLEHLRVSADQGRSVIFPTEIRTQTPRR